MTLLPLSYLPGVCKVDSTYTDSLIAAANAGRPAAGRITDMDKMRFIAGLPEKIGGNEQAVPDILDGVPRGMRDWRDNSQVIYLGIGTNTRLYYLSRNVVTDITPLRATNAGTISNAIDTTIGSNIVTVTHVDHGLLTNDYIQLTADTPVGGLNIAGTYFVTVIDPDTYTITTASDATSTASAGGGAIAYSYYRITLTDPFSTTSGSSTVIVTHANHGASNGDTVIFDGATAVGGLTIDGDYIITSVSSNSYTIDAGTAASSTAVGGGAVDTQYLISVGLVDSGEVFGYGTGGYGEDGFGEGGNTGIILAARIWCLAKYGAQLLANPTGGTIYIWDPTIGGRAYPMYGAPEMVLAMFVTPERFVMALGVSDNAMQVAWPDQSNYNDWVPTPLNTANIRTLQEGSFMVGGIAVRNGVSLALSNTCCYEFLYSGDNEIYSSNPSGDKNGLCGPLGICVLGGVAYWISPQLELWSWNGSSMPLPSDDIRDFVFTDINIQQQVKCVAASNTAKKEIWFFYCSANSTEIDRYVIYHIDQNCWSCGAMQRTSMIDRGLFTVPMGVNASGEILNLETGKDDNGVAMEAYVEFSPIDISKGDKNIDIMGYVPDVKRQSGAMELEILGKTYPQDTNTVYGPYTLADDGSTPRIDLRIGTKMVGYKLISNVLGGDFRQGMPKLELQPAGARR